MKVTIEIVADSADDALLLLKDARRALRRGREKDGSISCLGSWRLVVDDPLPAPIPFVQGDRVRCTDRESAYFGRAGTVEHSGPINTGVRWDGWSPPNDYCIKSNSLLEMVPTSPDQGMDTTIG